MRTRVTTARLRSRTGVMRLTRKQTRAWMRSYRLSVRVSPRYHLAWDCHLEAVVD